jgi:hypothetical protein
MPRWILVIFAVTVMLSGVATAGPPVAPNEVCIYEHVDYVGESACFRLEPGMRHKLVPTLGSMNDRASSIQMGEGVYVVIYQHARFAGRNIWHDSSGGLPQRFNDIVSSMIIVPRKKSLSGVTLAEAKNKTIRNMTVFYPLPDRLNELEARYPNLHWMSMNDEAARLWLHGDVEVTLYEHSNFKGKSITLPTVGTWQEGWIYLKRYQFSEIVSSLTVKTLKAGR